jgi:hypothetical protein
MTRETETLFYNHRIIIDAFVEAEPKSWLISKTNRLSPNGVCRVTLTQDVFDQHRDYIERDENGNIIGQWADYYQSPVTPTPIEPDIPSDDDYSPTPSLTAEITCSGKRQVKIGGSTKTLTVKFYDDEKSGIEYQDGEWSFTIDDVDVSDLLTITPVSEGKIKIKFLGGDEYLNKVLTATFTSGDAIASLSLELIAL